MLQSPIVNSSATGWWHSNGTPPNVGAEPLREALLRVGHALTVVESNGTLGTGTGGRVVFGKDSPVETDDVFPIRGFAPPTGPETPGDAPVRQAHGLRSAHVAGPLANGISSEELVEARGSAGMIGFFGSAGLSLDRIERAIDRLGRNLGDRPYGMNLIHSPAEPELESATVDLYLRRGIRRISASAYLDLTVPLVRYRVAGIHRSGDGEVVTPNKIIAKVSRVEVARKFFSPPPENILRDLVSAGFITRDQAKLAGTVPMAEDLTAEADSGGHTDNRPAITLLPTLLALRDGTAAAHEYTAALRVGTAGGIATPASAAAAFAMGAAFVLTGSINQARVEAGTSAAVREMLAKARQADVTMAPAADMFEMGVKVQILKRGTMFAQRARKLYELYRAHDSLDQLPAAHRKTLEWDYFGCSLEEAWERTRRFFEQRDPAQVVRAEKDPKHKMALVFRSYLGQSSKWAITGDPARKLDYQIWCGPAMGAFNEWAKGSFLEQPENRKVVTVAMNLMLGAAFLTRVHWLTTQGLPVPGPVRGFAPLEPETIQQLMA